MRELQGFVTLFFYAICIRFAYKSVPSYALLITFEDKGSPLKAEDYVTQIILSVVEAARSKVNILYERRTCEVCMYDDIAEETGYDKQALRDIKYVAQNVESSRRNDNLSFTHHREVASRWLVT